MQPPICEFLGWDSDFFGVRIARLRGGELTDGIAREALDYCKRESIDCLYLQLADHPEHQDLARRFGFQQVDTRITFARDLNGSADGHPACVRLASEEDLPSLKGIARCAHRDSRFYADPHFQASRCDQFYEQWIENSCSGWADRVFVCTNGSNHPAGYLACNVTPVGGSIGLVAVDGSHRGRGFGKQLVHAATSFFTAEGAKVARVVTQERNHDAMNFYSQQGFSIESRELYFHFWPRQGEIK